MISIYRNTYYFRNSQSQAIDWNSSDEDSKSITEKIDSTKKESTKKFESSKLNSATSSSSKRLNFNEYVPDLSKKQTTSRTFQNFQLNKQGNPCIIIKALGSVANIAVEVMPSLTYHEHLL